MKNLKWFKWLLELADVKPLIFTIAILMIAIVALSAVIRNREETYQLVLQDNKELRRNCDSRVDSLVLYYRQREILLNAEVKKSLEDMIDDYKRQLSDQKNLNSRIATTIQTNNKIITQNNNKLKNLKDGN